MTADHSLAAEVDQKLMPIGRKSATIIIRSDFSIIPCFPRPYLMVAHGRVVTSSCQITEVKQRRPWLVLGLSTGAQVTLLAMCKGVGQAPHIMPPLSTQQWWVPGGMRKLNYKHWL